MKAKPRALVGNFGGQPLRLEAAPTDPPLPFDCVAMGGLKSL